MEISYIMIQLISACHWILLLDMWNVTKWFVDFCIKFTDNSWKKSHFKAVAEAIIQRGQAFERQLADLFYQPHTDQCRSYSSFLLLARYVPNVAKKVHENNVIILMTDDRPTDRPRIFENFERPYLGNGSSDSLYVWFWFLEVGGSNGPTSGWIKSKMAAGRHLGKFQMAISLQRIVRSTSCLVLG